MSRAVVVSTCSDILFNYWKKNYETWKDQVDNLYIVDSKKDGHYPKNVEEVLKGVKEDTILVMHDDVFIYNKGEVNTYFSLAEQGKVVTPLHNNYSNIEEVNRVMEKKYGKIVSFYPYFLFISRELLNRTSINLEGNKNIDFNGVKCGGDQGFMLAWELLELGVEFELLNNDGRPNWYHAQGLSYGFLEYGGSFDEHKLAWLITILDLDPLSIACQAKEYKSYGKT